MLNRILVPLDGSPEQAAVVPALRRLIWGTDAAIHLLVVRPLPRQVERRGDRLRYLDELLADDRAIWGDYLREMIRRLMGSGVGVHGTLAFGDPWAETLAFAARPDVRLIAVVAPRRSWWARLRAPRLVDRLLARSPIPVLAIPQTEAAPPSAALHLGRAPA